MYELINRSGPWCCSCPPIVNLSSIIHVHVQGRIQDFKLGGGALKKIAPSGGRREKFWGISCEKSRFYDKKSYFFQLRREARKFVGYFVWKITILRQQIIVFPILGGARRVPPPGSAPDVCTLFYLECGFFSVMWST